MTDTIARDEAISRLRAVFPAGTSPRSIGDIVSWVLAGLSEHHDARDEAISALRAVFPAHFTPRAIGDIVSWVLAGA
jgi:hypothetical protein